ncbi:MAG: hypothetical protein AAFV93_08915 [Chloroflexota bacterium]
MPAQPNISTTIQLIGALNINLNDQRLQWQRSKTEALIAYLAVNRDGKRRETLATLLWENSTENNARASLRRCLSEINQSLFAPFVDIQRDTVAIIEYRQMEQIGIG